MISAMTARVAPSASDPESPMKIWAGWTLNHRNPSSAADDQRAQEGRVGLGRHVEQRDEHERHEREGERPAGEAVEAVGEVDAVGRGHDREGRERRRRSTASIGDVADERDRDLGDLVGALDLLGDERPPPPISHRSFWRARIPSPVRALR